MSQDQFLLDIKSTLDKIAKDKADELGVRMIDLDNTVETQELFSSEDDAIVWEYGTLAPDPRDPLYVLTFNIGGRTVKDSANYTMLGINGTVQELFEPCKRLEIKNYSGVVESEIRGFLNITQVIVSPQQYDKVSGVRMMSVTARAMRLA